MGTSWGLLNLVLMWGGLGLTVWIAARFIYYFNTAEAVGFWPKVMEAAGDSATYFAAKATLFAGALMTLAANGAEYLSDPSAKAQVLIFLQDYVTDPKVIGLVTILIAFLIWWARSRTKKA